MYYSSFIISYLLLFSTTICMENHNEPETNSEAELIEIATTLLNTVQANKEYLSKINIFNTKYGINDEKAYQEAMAIQDKIISNLTTILDQAKIYSEKERPAIIIALKNDQTNLENEKKLTENIIFKHSMLYNQVLDHLNDHKIERLSDLNSVKEFKEHYEKKTKAASAIIDLKTELTLPSTSTSETLTNKFETIFNFGDSTIRKKLSQETINKYNIKHEDGGDPEFLKRIVKLSEKLGIDTTMIHFIIKKNGISPMVCKSDFGIDMQDGEELLLNNLIVDPNIKDLTDNELLGILAHEYTHFDEGYLAGLINPSKIQTPLDIAFSHLQETRADISIITKYPQLSLKEKIELAETMHTINFENKMRAHAKKNFIHPSIHKRARNYKHGVRVLLNEPGAFTAAPKTWLSMKLFGLLPSEKHFAYLAAKTPVGASLITATVLTAGYCVVTTCKKWYQAYKEKRKKRSVKIDAVPNHPAPAAKNSNL